MRKWKRDIRGLILVSLMNDTLIWDMYKVVKGRPKDYSPEIRKRVTLDIDPYEQGAKSRADIARKVTKLRELEDRPDPATEDQVIACLAILRAIFREKKIDPRYGFTISKGKGGPNATGDRRFEVKEYDEIFKKDDPRIVAITAGDNYQGERIISELDFAHKHHELMYETMDDPILKARCKVKTAHAYVALAEAELALMLSYV